SLDWERSDLNTNTENPLVRIFGKWSLKADRVPADRDLFRVKGLIGYLFSERLVDFIRKQKFKNFEFEDAKLSSRPDVAPAVGRYRQRQGSARARDSSLRRGTAEYPRSLTRTWHPVSAIGHIPDAAQRRRRALLHRSDAGSVSIFVSPPDASRRREGHEPG